MKIQYLPYMIYYKMQIVQAIKSSVKLGHDSLVYVGLKKSGFLGLISVGFDSLDYLHFVVYHIR